MADILILDWMEEYDALTESEIHTYSNEQEHNHEVMIAIYEVLSEPYKFKGDNLVDGICRQLLDFYRSGEEKLKKFTLQYIPSLVFLHLNDKSLSSVQTLLVSLYNLEIIDAKGQPRTFSFRVPSIAQSSLYHDSTNLEAAFIAENSLRRWEECNSKLVSWGPLPQVECLNAQNRQRVVTALVFLYNQQIANVMPQGIEYTCRGITRLVLQGFHNCGSARSSTHSDSSFNQSGTPRIQLSSPLLLELLHIIYHAAQKVSNVTAIQALQDVIYRANYETYSEVLLAANAIKNLIQHTSSVPITARPTHTPAVAKSMITNASFRTKKLPDDIPIQDEVQQADAALDSITEETSTDDVEKVKSRGSVSALKHLPKLPGLGKKHKLKTPQAGDIEMTPTTDMNSINSINPDSGISDYNHTVHISAV